MDKQKIRALNIAIRNKELNVIKLIIEENISILFSETPIGTWLHVAATRGNLAAVKYLESKGLDLNVKSGIFGGTPINAAASNGQFEVVEYLISRIVILDVTDPQRNPLFGAIHQGKIEIVKLLINAGIDFKVKYTGENMKNMDAIAFAEEWGRTDIVNYLKSLG